jgi:mono/diheme cytochrome c family protein/glucose/arabinose dehydrogenase
MSNFSTIRRRNAFRCVAAAAVAAGLALPLFAKNKQNAGPEDPPILFPVPAPKPSSVEEALKTFKVPAGYRVECVASEPLVETPVAMAFDEQGRLWVCEMRGYMRDVDQLGEDQPLGRINVLSDTDGDGRMDESAIFLDGLVMPRAVLPVRGGALVGAPPELNFWQDTDGDGKADQKTPVSTGYGTRGGQPEHMANQPTLAIDNWIYNANHAYRYRFVRGKWVAEASVGRGQWGLSQDDVGRLYFSSNSDMARADLLPAHYFIRNPLNPKNVANNVGLLRRQTVWPSHKTPGVNRGYSKGTLRPDGTLANATAAGGAFIYRGDLFPTEFRNNMFTPEPSGNLIKRLVVKASADGKLSADFAYENTEFLTSTDERFRPVNMANGPDGAIYVADMYRGVLQHSGFLTNYLIKNIKARNLETPVDMGRIWRVVPENAGPAAVKVPADAAGQIALLGHPNGWVRDTAQRLLVERNDGRTVSAIAKVAATGESPLARLHALWTLEGMGRLEDAVPVKALADADPSVRAAAIRLSEPQFVPGVINRLLPKLSALAADPSADVQLQLGLSLSAASDARAEEITARLLSNKVASPDLMRDAVVSGLRGRELEFAERLLTDPAWQEKSNERAAALSVLARCVLTEKRVARVERLLDLTAAEPDGSWRQVELLKGMAATVPAGAKESRDADLAALGAKATDAGAAAGTPAGDDDAVKPTASKFAAPRASQRPRKVALPAGPKEKPGDAKKRDTTKPAPTQAKPGRNVVPLKIIYFDTKPAALEKLLASKDRKVAQLAQTLDVRLAWPGKAGVPPPPVIVPLTPAQQAQFDAGKDLYTRTCAACHQPGGLGQAGLAPPLVDSEWVLGSDKRLPRIIMQGIEGPISVAGTQWNLEMPALPQFSDEEIANVLTYIRREWDHGANPVSVETVKSVREQTKDRGEMWTAKELQAVK